MDALIRAHSNTDADQADARPLAPARESPEQLLATVQRLWRELQTASPAARPFLEREIRAVADRYRACAPEDLTLC
jgi:hypothetical protein